MGKILDFSEEETIANLIVEALEDTGFDGEQILAGLVNATVHYTYGSQQALDEVVDALLEADINADRD